ncbi:MAG: hypothetical protein EXR83_00455 [Gammaproteobacteria bacterium]|nr:hypothetical protein [Gammaproteobacteria bacterium]
MKHLVARVRSFCDAAGFDPTVVLVSHLEAAVRRRLRRTGLALADYRQQVELHDAERVELLEELLVRESWFFRDSAPFKLLGELAQTRWLGRGSALRVLSAPCAGGEEPYSIAMALLAGGLPLAALHLDGFDLSQRALAQAAVAEYSAQAVRLIPPPLMSNWLEASSAGRYRVHPALREAVNFRCGNLLELSTQLGPEKYDVIFSRNALIYFDARARTGVLDHLEALLQPAGLLFVGHAETSLLRGRAFTPCVHPGAFAFQHTPSGTPVRDTLPPPRMAQPRPSRRAGHSAITPPPAQPLASASVQLAQARELADRGVYAAAAELLSSLLTQRPDLVEAQHLMGLVRSAQGNVLEARRCFERALYLDPRHRPSLEHLALLLAAQGEDAAKVRLLQRRAERSAWPS